MCSGDIKFLHATSIISCSEENTNSNAVVDEIVNTHDKRHTDLKTTLDANNRDVVLS